MAFGLWLCLESGGLSGREASIQQRARVEGRVLHVGTRLTSVLVGGEVDGTMVPATSCRVLLHVPRASRHRIKQGQYIVATSQVWLPTEPAFEGDFSEAAWARNYQATMVGRILSLYIVQDEPWYQTLLDSSAEWCRNMLRAHTDTATSGILCALVLGDEQFISKEQRSWYVLSGTAHVLAVSGAHVMLLVTVLITLVGGSVRSWLSVAVILCIATFFVGITGASIPAVRALIMCALVLVGRLMQRSVDNANVIGAVIIIHLLYDPAAFNNVGFVLSNAAMLGIVLVTPKLIQAWYRIADVRTRLYTRAGEFLSLNLAASAAVGVPSALFFGGFALWSPIVNILVVPLMSIAMIAGMLMLSVGNLGIAVADGCGFAAHGCIQLSEVIVRAASESTPLFDQRLAVVVAAGFLCTVLWLCLARTIRGYAVRCLGGILLTMACAIQLPSPPQGVFVKTSVGGLEVLVDDGVRSRRASIGTRFGIPFVRSLDERH